MIEEEPNLTTKQKIGLTLYLAFIALYLGVFGLILYLVIRLLFKYAF